MAARAVAAVAVLGASAAAASSASDKALGLYSQCKYQSSGSTFDLTTMTLPQGSYYQIADSRDSTIAYWFNICGEIQAPTGYAGACTVRSSANDLAFQVDQEPGGGANCYRIGGPQALGWNFSLYDVKRPARGVVISYLGGESLWCPNNRNRTFSVELLCGPVAPATQYPQASVIELNSCDYRMQLKSIAGCPTECLATGSICSNNGVCGWDTDTLRSKCFCYTGFEGAQCGTASAAPGGMSAEGIILIVVCVVLAGVIGLVSFMFIKLRKLQVDPAAYGQLEGRFNELGMLA